MFSPPESCLCHFFYLVQESCHSVVFPSRKKKKKKDPCKTHHSLAAKTYKINTHRCGTQQPPTAAKPNTLPHSPVAKTQNLTLDHCQCQSPRRANATPPCLVPPLSPRLRAATRSQSPTPAEDPHRRDYLCL